MAKERFLVPPQLQNRVGRLVKAHAKRLGTSETDARRLVEIAVIQRGIELLEQDGADALELEREEP